MGGGDCPMGRFSDEFGRNTFLCFSRDWFFFYSSVKAEHVRFFGPLKRGSADRDGAGGGHASTRDSFGPCVVHVRRRSTDETRTNPTVQVYDVHEKHGGRVHHRKKDRTKRTTSLRHSSVTGRRRMPAETVRVWCAGDATFRASHKSRLHHARRPVSARVDGRGGREIFGFFNSFDKRDFFFFYIYRVTTLTVDDSNETVSPDKSPRPNGERERDIP